MRLFLLVLSICAAYVSAAGTTIIRVRTVDGSVMRVPLSDDGSSSTISSILRTAGIDLDAVDSEGKGSVKCQVGPPGCQTDVLDLSPNGKDRDTTAKELGLKHGSMITILPPPMPKKKQVEASSSQDENENSNRFDPFPDLAKSTSFSAANRRARAMSRGVSRGMTYGDISRVRSTMHTVEAQPTGSLNRVYVCQVGAARFQNHCVVQSTKKKPNGNTTKKGQDLNTIENRVALLFGTINRERLDQSRKVARTSLSSTRDDQKMCEVAKVHAIWEPPMQKPMIKGKHYDEDCLLSTYIRDSQDTSAKETPADRAIRVAGWLGLQPVGWIFSYADEDRHEDGDALPVHGRDAVVGAKLQIETMKRRGREEGRKFITLSLDGRIGAAEAFQLSDVCVQMVAENVLSPPIVDEKLQSTRFLTLKDPVVVSGEETKRLDSVLLLVNTAMLSHVGLYSGGMNAPIGGNVKKTSGALLGKTRKRILEALENKGGSELLAELCDFDILLAIDALIGKEESEKLCSIVRKYARGQKKGTVVGEQLKLTLRSILG
ncbi:hypothetical protein ACHAWT_003133 [Skeletonema menzelii]